MKVIVRATHDGGRDLLLKRPLGETLLARSARTAAEALPGCPLYGLTECPQYAEHFAALDIPLCEPPGSLREEFVLCIDARYATIGAETIEKAAEFSRTLSCPVQSLGTVAEHPALGFEVTELMRAVHGLREPSDSFKIDLGVEPDSCAIYWINVRATREGRIVAGGWTEFTVPPHQQCLGKHHAQTACGGLTAEIMVDVVIEKVGKEARIAAFWHSPVEADEFHLTLLRTVTSLTGRTKQYTIPGLMHADPVSGCLVNPATGEKLVNRQAFPPLLERVNAVVAGRAREAADVIAGKIPKNLRGMRLSEEESICVRNELDVLRLRQRLISRTGVREPAEASTTRREQP